MTNTWISKAVADQRKGRAGRLKEGECYRLFSKEKYESFEQYPIPEVMRTPLEKLIVTLKVMLIVPFLEKLLLVDKHLCGNSRLITLIHPGIPFVNSLRHHHKHQ